MSEDLVRGVTRHRRTDARNVFFEQVFPVPVGDDNSRRTRNGGADDGVPSGSVRARPPGRALSGQDISGEIGQQECQEAGRHEERREQ